MKKSNLYIEKIYGNHPIACWALDDNISFRQLVSQNANDWTITGGDFDFISTKTVSPKISDTMFEKFNIYGNSLITYPIPSLVLDPNKEEITFGTWIFHPSTLVTKYEIGFIDHTDETEYFSEYIFIQSEWRHVYDTFPISMLNSQCELFIRIYADNQETLYINSPSLGQDSEEYCSYSGGYTTTMLQSGLLLDEYGRNSENNGTYPLNEYGSVMVREGGIPLAFGSYQSLSIVPNSTGGGIPIKLPGSGFLHDYGKYNNYTLEMWMRIVNSSSTPVRIFGAIDSTDGIYVEEDFISIYLGPYTKSYFVGKWYRPMLIHFEYSQKMAMLFINGEKVISMDIDITKIPFSTGEDSIAVYASNKIDPYEIDSISLYPYTMPAETAKRHFVYGQGVQEFDFSNDKFQKKTVQVDFPFAEYSYNVIYPDTLKWRNGYSINLDTSSTYIKPSTFPLPEILCQNGEAFVKSEQWLLDNYELNQSSSDVVPYVKMLPTPDYTESSIYFKTLALMENKIEAFFGVFKSPEIAIGNQEVLRIDNKQTGESFKIILNFETLDYQFTNSNGQTFSIGSSTVSTNNYFAAGIKISEISTLQYTTVGIFFSNQNKLSMSIGGSNSSNTFIGKFFGMHFVDPVLFQRYFSNGTYFINGIVDSSKGLSLTQMLLSYSMIILNSNTSLIFDVGTTGYWEDALPLSMFGKNILTSTGKSYDLDIIQFNIDAQYKDIYYANSTMVPYGVFESIVNIFFETYENISSHYNTYDELYQSVLQIYNEYKLDTGVRTYVKLQRYDEVGNKPYSDYVNTISASDNNIVTFNTSTLDTTKYEVYDNYTIIIPKEIDFNEYYLTVSIETRVRGSITKNMVIKRCELSSFVYNDGVPTKIGTKYSIPIYPFAEAI